MRNRDTICEGFTVSTGLAEFQFTSPQNRNKSYAIKNSCRFPSSPIFWLLRLNEVVRIFLRLLRSYLILPLFYMSMFSHTQLIGLGHYFTINKYYWSFHACFFSLSLLKYSLEILSLFFRYLMECLRFLYLTREAMCDGSSFWKQTISPILLLIGNIFSYHISSNTQILLCCDSETTDFHAHLRRKAKNYFPKTNQYDKQRRSKHLGIFLAV